MSYVTADYVYDKIGVGATSIDATQMGRILTLADSEVDRIIKTTCTPKTKIELYDGDNKNYLYLNHIPLLTVNALEIDDTTISLEKIRQYNTGRIILLSDAEQAYFYSNKNLKNVRVKYLYGWLEESTTQTLNTAAETAGDSQTITVTTGDGDSFEEGDYIRIVGFDGYEETTILTDVTGDVLTCDLILPHEAGSQITLLQVPVVVQQLAAVIGAIMGATYMMGNTYTFATSYTIPDFTVNKGVPYPHFNRNMEVWVKERDFLMTQIPCWPVFA